MSSCEAICDLLHEWADGELNAEARREVDSHLEDCAECRRQAGSIERVKQLVRAKGRLAPVPPGLEERVRSAIAADRVDSGGKETPTLLRRWSWVRIAAAVVLVSGVGVFMQLSRPGSPGFLVHASMAQEALAQHRNGPREYRPKNMSEVADYLAARQLPQELPPFPADRVRVAGVGSSRFGGWCDAVHVRYERTDRAGAFSLFVIPTDIRLGLTEQRMLWHRFCLCFHDGAHTVICFNRNGVYYSIVTDEPKEEFHSELLMWQGTPGEPKAPMDKGPGMTKDPEEMKK